MSVPAISLVAGHVLLAVLPMAAIGASTMRAAVALMEFAVSQLVFLFMGEEYAREWIIAGTLVQGYVLPAQGSSKNNLGSGVKSLHLTQKRQGNARLGTTSSFFA